MAFIVYNSSIKINYAVFSDAVGIFKHLLVEFALISAGKN